MVSRRESRGAGEPAAAWPGTGIADNNYRRAARGSNCPALAASDRRDGQAGFRSKECKLAIGKAIDAPADDEGGGDVHRRREGGPFFFCDSWKHNFLPRYIGYKCIAL